MPYLSLLLLGSYSSATNPADARTILVIIAFLLLYYALVAWWVRRRLESSGATIVVQYAPPANMSPAEVRYLVTGNADPQTVAAVLVDLAARGLISIRPLDNQYAIAPLRFDLPEDLPEEERVAFETMFDRKTRAATPSPLSFQSHLPYSRDCYLVHPIGGANSMSLGLVIYRSLRRRLGNKYFTSNPALSFPMTVLSVFLAIFACSDYLRTIGSKQALSPLSGMLHVVFIASTIALINYLPAFDDVLHQRSLDPNRTVYFFLCVVGLLVTTAMLFADSFLCTVSLCAVVAINVLFPRRFLRTPTGAAVRRLDLVEGYRHFLATVDADKFHRMMQPDWAPNLGTTRLAYSLALGLGEAWQDYLATSSFQSIVYAPTPIPTDPLAVSTPVVSERVLEIRQLIKRIAVRLGLFGAVWSAYGFYKHSLGTYSFSDGLVCVFLALLIVTLSLPAKAK